MKGTSFYEEQMGMAFDSIPCGLCIYQIVNGQILPRFRNPAFYEILGYSDTHRSDAGQGLDLGRVHPEDAGILKENACPIVLGGDHSITLAELRAAAKKYGPVALVHFDSHSDLCDEVFGQKYNHGTPFRRALEENLIDASHSIQVGMRGSLYDPDEHKMAAELGMKLIPAHKVREMGLKTLVKTILERVGDKPCFLTFDIDFVDPAYAPGTGTPEVGGFTSLEALELVRNIKDLNFVGFDLVEVLPAYDHGEITAYLAANIVFEYLSILAMKKKAK